MAAPPEQTAEVVDLVFPAPTDLEAEAYTPAASADVLSAPDDVAEALALLLQDGGMGTEIETEVAAAPATPRLALEALALDLTPTPAPVSEETFEIHSLDASFTSAEPPAPVLKAVPDASDAHAVFVKALVDVALGAGATRAAALIPSLLDGTGGVHGLSPELGEGLVAARVLQRTGDVMRPEQAFAAIADAWRRVLREESSDLSACGASTLDAWGAELLAALGVGRDGRSDVRRELRKRGVAAFGMRVAA